MYKGNFEVDILINGRPVDEYYHEGRTYVEGRIGTRYEIRIRNNSGKRILAVPTVDGLSVLNGQAGSYESNGYIIDAHNSTVIKGWRKSDKEIAEFYFSDVNDSYASRVGKNGNQGIIGVAIFYEKSWWNYWDGSYMNCQNTTYPLEFRGTTYSSTLNASTVNMNVDGIQSKSIGTGWGEVKRSEVVEVPFTKESSIPVEVFEIYYNTRENLEYMGVKFCNPVYVSSPQAFPNKYCEPPR